MMLTKLIVLTVNQSCHGTFSEKVSGINYILNSLFIEIKFFIFVFW